MTTSPDGLIDPSRFRLKSSELDPAAIERAASTLTSTGSSVRDSTEAVGRSWGGLRSGYYGTGHDHVYAAMQPVEQRGSVVDEGFVAAAAALDDLALALTHAQVRLTDLEDRANRFRAEAEQTSMVGASASTVGQGSEDASGESALSWLADPAIAERNRALLTEYRVLEQAAIEESERCARTLERLASDASVEPFERPVKPATAPRVLLNVEHPIHEDLDIAGLLPIIGEPADLLNGVIYAAEGNIEDAAISFAAVAPIIGSGGTLLRITSRLKNAANAAAIRATFRFASSRTLASKFDRHASIFGIMGNRNPQTLAQFRQAVTDHVNDPNTLTIVGTYRTDAAIHFVNPDTGINVLAYPDGRFWSAWRLGDDQLANVLSRGSL